MEKKERNVQMVPAFKKLIIYKSRNSEQRVKHEVHREAWKAKIFRKLGEKDIQFRTNTELQHRLT